MDKLTPLLPLKKGGGDKKIVYKGNPERGGGGACRHGSKSCEWGGSALKKSRSGVQKELEKGGTEKNLDEP